MRVNFWRVGLLGLVTIVLSLTQFNFDRYQQQFGQTATTSASPILVAAAASLQPALQSLTPTYTQANPDRAVSYNFAASGVLAQQIQQGAPVDVFISAADKQMSALEQQGLLAAGTQSTLLTNQLVLIAPKQSLVPLTDWRQLTNPAIKRIAIGEPRTVPAGQYAIEVFQNLGILESVKSKFVLGNNVKSVLTAVETGNVDAGIVYLTDAKNSSKVQIAAIADDKIHSSIRYPVAILKSSKSPARSRQYVEFLHSKSAIAIFEKYGFGIAKSSS